MDTRKILLVAGITSLLVIGSITMSTVVAEEIGKAEKHGAIKKEQAKDRALLLGGGLAIEDGDDKPYKSSMKLKLTKSNAEGTDYTVKQGLIVINDEDSPVRYPIIADKWSIQIEDNGFSASGYSQDTEGITYKVSLEGEYLNEANHGKFYLVKGEFQEDANANGEVYELHYIVMLTDVKPQSASVSSNQ